MNAEEVQKEIESGNDTYVVIVIGLDSIYLLNPICIFIFNMILTHRLNAKTRRYSDPRMLET